MGRSEMKTANYTSEGYFEVSVVKVSARSDQIKGGSYLAQFNTVNEKRKTIFFSKTERGTLKESSKN